MSEPRSIARRLATRLGLFAVLLQAVLFGWHHHDLRVAGRLPAPILENSTAPSQLAVDEDGCEICQVLHHLTAAPVNVAAALPPLTPAVASESDDDAFVARPLALAFRARAPPLA